MDLNTITLSAFVESELKRLGHSNRTIADFARVSFRAIADVRSGKIEAGLQSGAFTGRKLIGVTMSTRRILNGLGADVSFWMNRLGLDNTIINARIPLRGLEAHTPFIAHMVQALNTPVSEETLQRVLDKAISAQYALGDVFTTQTFLRLFLNELR